MNCGIPEPCLRLTEIPENPNLHYLYKHQKPKSVRKNRNLRPNGKFRSPKIIMMIKNPSLASRLMSGLVVLPSLLIGIFVLNPQSSSAQVMRDRHSEPSTLRGDVAVDSLKRDGSFASLEEAMKKVSGNTDDLLPNGSLESTTLTASDGASGDEMGFAVAVSGDTAVAGVIGSDPGGVANAGAAYVFVRANNVWSQQAKLVASDPGSSDYLGHGVAIDGDTIVVGAPEEDASGISNAGSVYVFTRSGTTWTQQAKLNAADPAASDFFGYKVAVDGDTIVVGAPFDDETTANTGSAYIFTRSGSTWTQQAKLNANVADRAVSDHFGSNVTISGDDVLIAADSATFGGLTDRGAAFVFTRSGTTWTFQQRLTPTDAAAFDYLGSLYIEGDFAVLGASGKNSNTGAVYTFTRSGTTWTQSQKLIASNRLTGDLFGASIGVSREAMIISAPGRDVDGKSNQGAAYIFTKSGSTWSETSMITASDGQADDIFGNWGVSVDGDTIVVAVRGDDVGSNMGQGSMRVFQTKMEISKKRAPDAASNDTFGWSVSVSGNTAVVGVPQDQDAGLATGSAHVFVRTGNVWNHQQKLTATGGAAGDRFGESVSIWDDTIAVGAYLDDVTGGNDGGSVHVFVRAAGVWSLQQSLTASDAGPGQYFGFSASLHNNRLAIGAPGFSTNRGAVYVFERSAGLWAETTKLLASDGVAGNQFGYHVGLSGNTIVASAPYYNENRGAAYVFTGSGSSWVQDARLNSTTPTSGDYLGTRVSINDDTIAVGATDSTVGGVVGRGFVIIFKRTAGFWNTEQRIDSPVNATGYFGIVSVSADTLVVGAPAVDSKGAVYVFTRSGGIWTLQRKLTAADGSGMDYFGFSAAVSGETVVVGAPLKDISTGAAYMHYWGPASPTAGGSNFSGRILDTNGRGLANATVVLTDFSGVERTVQTGSFGRFSFANLPSGESYIIDVRSKRFQFSPQVVNLASDLDAFTMSASGRRR